MIGKSIIEFITNTPMKHLSTIYKGAGMLSAKMEFLQPGGSVKDRTALGVITEGLKSGRIQPG